MLAPGLVGSGASSGASGPGAVEPGVEFRVEVRDALALALAVAVVEEVGHLPRVGRDVVVPTGATRARQQLNN